GKHCQIQAPPNSDNAIHNYEGSFSLILMIIMDARYRFIWVDIIGHYGSLNDAGIWSSTDKYHALENNTISILQARFIPNTNTILLFCMIGDDFSFKIYLMLRMPISLKVDTAKWRNLATNNECITNFGRVGANIGAVTALIASTLNTADDVKYSAVIRHLDEATMITVTDILKNPPENDKYNRLKETLIARFTNSQEKQMRTLLLGIELGEKKPSQLLREMRALAGENAIESLLRILIYAVQATLTNYQDTMQQLIKQMATLSIQIEKLTKQSRARSRSKSHTRSPDNTHDTATKDTGQCYYHQRFGDQARKCTPPCSAQAKDIVTSSDFPLYILPC
ncbi:hypothetical protein ALC56_03197, partial [Trachymyrmex septentrionalis]